MAQLPHGPKHPDAPYRSITFSQRPLAKRRNEANTIVTTGKA